MISVVFQDDQILVLEKPAGIVSTSSETQIEPSLEDILGKEFSINLDRSGIVHRLDKDTSGLLVVAKTKESLENLQSQFKERNVQKEYLALVHGLVEKEGIIEASILRHPGDREKFTTIDQLKFKGEGLTVKEAVTEYKPMNSFQLSVVSLQQIFEGFNSIQMRKLERTGYGKFTLLRCFPRTGRTHQIRVHLKYLGFPIVGDDKYGGRKTTRLDHRWVKRQFLHAAHLEFDHPTTGKRMSFDSPLPNDLQEALDNLQIIK
ncbi:MAG: RluA family pseudouridine synthase [Candidatus Daviesbacteria bacterium]|nr:RluA family pseudouridine synthase [Candidatus Daviesbacteria bacterium]